MPIRLFVALCENLLNAALAKTRATHRQLGIGSVSKKQNKTKKQNKNKQTNKQKIKN